MRRAGNPPLAVSFSSVASPQSQARISLCTAALNMHQAYVGPEACLPELGKRGEKRGKGREETKERGNGGEEREEGESVEGTRRGGERTESFIKSRGKGRLWRRTSLVTSPPLTLLQIELLPSSSNLAPPLTAVAISRRIYSGGLGCVASYVELEVDHQHPILGVNCGCRI